MAHSEFRADSGRVAVLTDFALPSRDEFSFCVDMDGGRVQTRVPVSLLEETLEFGEFYGCARVGSVGDESILITKSGSDDEYTVSFPAVSKEAAVVIGTGDYVEFVRRALDGKRRKAEKD